MFLKKSILKGALAGLITTAAISLAHAADCGPAGKSIRILGSDFPAIQAVSGTAKANCEANAGELTVTLRDNTRDIMNQALTPNPAEYTSVIVANSTRLRCFLRVTPAPMMMWKIVWRRK